MLKVLVRRVVVVHMTSPRTPEAESETSQGSMVRSCLKRQTNYWFKVGRVVPEMPAPGRQGRQEDLELGPLGCRTGSQQNSVSGGGGGGGDCVAVCKETFGGETAPRRKWYLRLEGI